MTKLGERMREWISQRRGVKPAPAADALGKLPGEIRNDIYTLLAAESYICEPPLAMDGRCVLLEHRHLRRRRGGEADGLLHVNRQYGREFYSVLRQAQINHHRVDVVVSLGRDLASDVWQPCQDQRRLLANGDGPLSIFITMKCDLKRLGKQQRQHLPAPIEALFQQYLAVLANHPFARYLRQCKAIFIQLKGAFWETSLLGRLKAEEWINTYPNASAILTLRPANLDIDVHPDLQVGASYKIKWVARQLRAGISVYGLSFDPASALVVLPDPTNGMRLRTVWFGRREVRRAQACQQIRMQMQRAREHQEKLREKRLKKQKKQKSWWKRAMSFLRGNGS